MRTIKFRAWSKHYKRFESYTLKQIVSGKVNLWFFDESPVIHQWTGLTDKKGTEIYEDDIVRILYTDWMSKDDDDPRTLEEYLNSISHIGQVIWDDEAAAYALLVKGSSWSIHHGQHGRIEVIGNVYENPELL